MGHLRDGQWHNDDVATTDDEGAFKREESEFRDTIAPDHPAFQPEKNRYHLYVSFACPWAHRTLIARRLKKLDDLISVDVVHPHMLENSWTFDTDFPATTGDTVNAHDYLYEVYQQHDPDVTTKVTVPVLWDKKTSRIVNNESSEILRIFNRAFDHLVEDTPDLYPEPLRNDIDTINERVYEPINNGVYKTGFAKTQASFEEAFHALFDALDGMDQRLADRAFLAGDQLTEADIRLVTTLIRFDPVYHVHFKCNDRKISEYPNLSRYLLRLFDLEAVGATTHFDHIKQHYYYSHDFINPHRIVPPGPRSNLPQT